MLIYACAFYLEDADKYLLLHTILSIHTKQAKKEKNKTSKAMDDNSKQKWVWGSNDPPTNWRNYLPSNYVTGYRHHIKTVFRVSNVRLRASENIMKNKNMNQNLTN